MGEFDRKQQGEMTFKQPSKKREAVFRVTMFIVVFVLWATVSPETAFLGTVFLVWWAFRLDSRILAGVAIIFLLGTAMASAFHVDARAEQLAVYVYFLLVMVVALQIFEYRREGDVEEVIEEMKKVAVADEAPPQKVLSVTSKEKQLVISRERPVRRIPIQHIRSRSKKL